MKQYETEGATIKKWYTVSEFVDEETGELLSRKEVEKNYHKLKTDRSVEITDTHGIIKYITRCKHTRQTRLFE